MARSSTSFGPGNQAAKTHGLRSAEYRESYRLDLLGDMRQLVDHGLGDAHPGDEILRDLLACSLADVRQANEYINAHGGPLSTKGQIANASHFRRARERDALALMDRLGMGPKARTQILSGAVQTEGLASQLARARLQQVQPHNGAQPRRGEQASLKGGTQTFDVAPGASGGHGEASDG